MENQRIKFKGGQRLWVGAPLYLAVILGMEFLARALSFHHGVSAWYPPAGVGAAFLLYYGIRFLPIHIIGSWLGAALFFGPDMTILLSVLHAITVSLVYLLASVVVNGQVRSRNYFEKPGNVMFFLFTFAVASMLCSSIVVAQYAAFQVNDGFDLFYQALSFASGDFIGILVVAPFLLYLLLPCLDPSPTGPQCYAQDEMQPTLNGWKDWTPAALMIAVIIGLEYAALKNGGLHVDFLFFAPLTFLAIRQGSRGAILCILMCNLALVATLLNAPFASADIIQHQLLMLALGGTGLFLGALTQEQWRLRHEMRQSERMEMVGRMAGNLAHDFNNFLTVINNHCNFILQSPAEELTTENRESLEAIRLAGTKAAALTTRLLSFSRFIETPSAEADVNQILRDMQITLRSLVGEDITLDLDLNETNVSIDIGKGQLEQVVINLVMNAKDAISGTGNIKVHTRIISPIPEDMDLRSLDPSRQYLELQVEDSGSGIPPEIMDRIFEPFFTTKAVGKGTGLGLSSVKMLVEQAEGTVYAESHPGRGTSIYLYWPLSNHTAVISEKDSPPPLADQTLHGQIDILVAEDEPSVQKVLRRILENANYSVDIYGSGEEALAALKTRPNLPSMVITDLIMPGMTGIELAEQIREEFPSLPVALMSGYADDELLDRGLDKDRFSLLKKPYTASELLGHIQTTIQSGSNEA